MVSRGASNALAQANAYFSAGRMEDALRLAGEYLVESPGDLDASWVVILALLELGDAEQATSVAAEAATVNPDHSDAWRLLAYALIDGGKEAEALAAAGRAVQLDPESWWTHETACRVLLAAKKWRVRRQALAEAEIAVQLAPQQPNAYLAYGDAILARGRFRRAERAYRMALRLDPAHRLARERLGLLDLNQAMTLNAYRAFVPLVAENPGDRRVSGHADFALWRLGAEIAGALTLFAWLGAAISAMAVIADGHDGGVLAMVMVFLAVMVFMIVGVYIVRYFGEVRLLSNLWSEHRPFVLAAASSVASVVVGIVLSFSGLALAAALVMGAGALAGTVLWFAGRRRLKRRASAE